MADPVAEGRSGGFSKDSSGSSKGRIWSRLLRKDKNPEKSKKKLNPIDERFRQAIEASGLERQASNESSNTIRSQESSHSTRSHASDATTTSHATHNSRPSIRERNGGEERGSESEGKHRRTPRKLQKRNVPKSIQRLREETNPSVNSSANDVQRTASFASGTSDNSSLSRRRADTRNRASTSHTSVQLAVSPVPSREPTPAEASRTNLSSPSRVHFSDPSGEPKGRPQKGEGRPHLSRLLSTERLRRRKHQTRQDGQEDTLGTRLTQENTEEIPLGALRDWFDKRKGELMTKLEQLEKRFSLPPRKGKHELHGYMNRRTSRDSDTIDSDDDIKDRRVKVRVYSNNIIHSFRLFRFRHLESESFPR